MLNLILRQELRGVNMPGTDIALHMDDVKVGVTWQHKWRVPGGTKVTHVGLSLLEVA